LLKNKHGHYNRNTNIIQPFQGSVKAEQLADDGSGFKRLPLFTGFSFGLMVMNRDVSLKTKIAAESKP